MTRVHEMKNRIGVLIVLTPFVVGWDALSARAAEPQIAQAGRPAVRRAAEKPDLMPKEITRMRAKIAELEAALQRGHQGQSTNAADAADLPGMQMGLNQMMTGMEMMRKGMEMMSGARQGASMMGDMPMGVGQARQGGSQSPPNMEAMSGMRMKDSGSMRNPQAMQTGKAMKMGMKMGRAKKLDKMKMMGMAGDGRDPSQPAALSALPGFPGISHLYHIGSTGFFIDHGEHLALTPEQTKRLNGIQERSSLEGNTFERKIAEAEQELWTLTAADRPDANEIESKVRQVEKLKGDRRLAFIRAVGEAAKILTDDQRLILMGMQDNQEEVTPRSPEDL